MSAIPTESRIFADRILRNAKRLEQMHASKIAPGATSWSGALHAICDRMAYISPIKRAGLVAKTTGYLRNISPADCVHIHLADHIARRAAFLCFATFGAGHHPLMGVEEDGIRIQLHAVSTDRRGLCRLITNSHTAYVSWHALGRLHERGGLSTIDVTAALAQIGALGYLIRHSDKHIDSGLCLRIGDTLAVGSIRHAAGRDRNDQERIITFYDVRTMLPIADVSNHDMLEQGHLAAETTAAWLASEANPDIRKTAVELIPFLPARDDDYATASARRYKSEHAQHAP